MQIILQATHGVVSGEPSFFYHAFGGSIEGFRDILLRPHHQIFNREWYETGDGRDEYLDFQRAFRKLSDNDRAEVLSLLSSCDPRGFRLLPKKTASSAVRKILPFYVPISKESEAAIWAARRAQSAAPSVSDEERVEDAGLDDDDSQLPLLVGEQAGVLVR
jgi:hypothetical protein